MFRVLPNLTSCSYFFYKSNADNNLSTCYYYSNSGSESEYLNGIGLNLFTNNSVLKNTSYMFTNNTGIVGYIPPDIFDSCKASLTNVDSMFKGCIGINGIDRDGDLGSVGVSDKWFENAVSLQGVSHFLDGVTGINCEIPNNLFLGCASLKDTSYMFNNCSGILGQIPVTLFNDSRKTLENVEYMFCNTGISGTFPEGEYTEVEGTIGYQKCLSNEEGALQVLEPSNVTNLDIQIAYNTVVGLSPGLIGEILFDGSSYVKPIKGILVMPIQLGLLSDCNNLTSTANMFSGCVNLGIGSGIPTDLFYVSDSSKKFNKLKNVSGMFDHCGFNQAYTDTNTGIRYFCKPDLFVNCPVITNMSRMFFWLESMPAVEIPNTLFDKQTKLENTSQMFYRCYNLTGGITQNMMRSCIGTLTNTSMMFCMCDLTNIASGFLNLGAPNKKLKYMRAMFYDNDRLEGAAPDFWNKSKFIAVEESQNGYYGAFYNTAISNKAQAEAVSPNWTIVQSGI
jgi:hypothetical protein